MNDIIGTIINIKDFLSSKETNVKINKGSKDEIAFSLSANRNYIIPDFQREIKWKKENLIELMKDVSQGKKFLGNVILSQSLNDEYQIIDGQQRITVLLMLIKYIKEKFYEEIGEIIEPCSISIESFSEYQTFAQNSYSYNGLEPDKTEKIKVSDIFNQAETYNNLYETIKGIDILKNATRVRGFISNLLGCEINIILSKENSVEESVGYFLDVNLKGVKLDTEDIFKGYLYSYDSRDEIRSKWQNFRKAVFKFNNCCKKITRNNKKDSPKDSHYPLVKILNHYFYCNLYSASDRYAKLEFNDDFCLSNVFLKDDGERFYIGEHLIKVINNNAYMQSSLDRICKFLEFATNVVENETPSLDFKRKFESFPKNECLDSKEISIIYNFIRKLLLDNNVIPKSLVMKYILETFMKNEPPTKQEIRYIYTMYFLAVLFSVFENKKGKDAILDVLKDENWQVSAFDQIEHYLKTPTQNSRTAQFRYATNPDDDEQRYRAISLAAIYNFFKIEKNVVVIKNNTISNLQNYLSNSIDYSVEHFIVNNGKICKYSVGNDSFEYHYLDSTKKYAKSVFNFIFVSENVNEQLGNLPIVDKCKLLTDNKTVTCDYSKMVIEKAKKVFKEIRLYDKDSETKYLSDLNTYYSYAFVNEFDELVQEIVTEFFNKFIKSEKHQ